MQTRGGQTSNRGTREHLHMSRDNIATVLSDASEWIYSKTKNIAPQIFPIFLYFFHKIFDTFKPFFVLVLHLIRTHKSLLKILRLKKQPLDGILISLSKKLIPKLIWMWTRFTFLIKMVQKFLFVTPIFDII